VTAADAFEYHEFNVLVRDLDPQGHVANHVYVAYLSEARARFMRAVDDGGPGFRPSVVAEMRCRYRSPLSRTATASRCWSTRPRGTRARFPRKFDRVSRRV